MPEPECVLETRGAVAIATLNRPAVRNALNDAAVQSLIDVLERVEADAGLAVLIVTRAGSAFSAGVDLKELGAGSADPALTRRRVERTQQLSRRIINHPKVVIAAVNGPAVGMGAELCAAADLRIAASSASFAFPEVARGVFPTNGVTYLLPRMVGHARAMDWLLTGRTVALAEALAGGMLAEVVEGRPVLDRAIEIAERIAGNAPIPVRLVKRILRRTFAMDIESALEGETDGVMECMKSADFQEGIRSFFERRPPRYRGG